MLDKYKKTISLRLSTNDLYNLNRIKYFWEKEDNTNYNYSQIIRICLDIICQTEDEMRKQQP